MRRNKTLFLTLTLRKKTGSSLSTTEAKKTRVYSKKGSDTFHGIIFFIPSLSTPMRKRSGFTDW